MYLDNLKTASDVDGHFLTFHRNRIEGVDIKLVRLEIAVQ